MLIIAMGGLLLAMDMDMLLSATDMTLLNMDMDMSLPECCMGDWSLLLKGGSS